MKFRTFPKKRRVSWPNYYRSYCIRKRYLLKRLKGLASAHHFSNQRVNSFETLLKSTRHHYFPFFPRIRDKLSWKKSALVTSEIFRVFVNTLTPDDKYSRRNMQIFWQQLQTLLSQQQKTFYGFFIAFPKCAWNLKHSETKKRISYANYYRNYCIRKRYLLKRLKGLGSEHHSLINVLTGSKHCWS